MNTRITCCLSVMLTFAVACEAKADLIIDEFSVGFAQQTAENELSTAVSPNTLAGAQRKLRTLSQTHVLNNGDKTIKFVSNGASRAFALIYDLGTYGTAAGGAYDLSATAGNILKFAYTVTDPASTYKIVFDIIDQMPASTNVTPGVSSSYSVAAAPQNSPLLTPLNAPISSFSVPGALSAVRYLRVTVTRTDTNSNSQVFSPIKLWVAGTVAAVPEPATMTLLGLSLVGGFVAHRRQNRKTEAAEVA